MKNIRIIFFLSIIILVNSCRKDKGVFSPPIIHGYVYGDNLLPLKDAKVVIYTKIFFDMAPSPIYRDLDSVLTDSKGYFSFPARKPVTSPSSTGYEVGIVVSKDTLYSPQRFIISLSDTNAIYLHYSSTLKLNIKHLGNAMGFDMKIWLDGNQDMYNGGSNIGYFDINLWWKTQVDTTFFIPVLGNSNWSQTYLLNTDGSIGGWKEFTTTSTYCPNFDTTTYILNY